MVRRTFHAVVCHRLDTHAKPGVGCGRVWLASPLQKIEARADPTRGGATHQFPSRPAAMTSVLQQITEVATILIALALLALAVIAIPMALATPEDVSTRPPAARAKRGRHRWNPSQHEPGERKRQLRYHGDTQRRRQGQRGTPRCERAGAARHVAHRAAAQRLQRAPHGGSRGGRASVPVDRVDGSGSSEGRPGVSTPRWDGPCV